MKTNRNINVPSDFKNPHNERRVRKGKTHRDRVSGYSARRESNRSARNQSDKKDREWKNCHGKGNSSVAFKLGSRRHQKG